ncbi:hypothetical protein BVI2075_230008 [Burkholderia vietnamiensis]|nr:hypothetical protein BVI2075_230008 [Burkholderia vietnamiensis]
MAPYARPRYDPNLMPLKQAYKVERRQIFRKLT